MTASNTDLHPSRDSARLSLSTERQVDRLARAHLGVMSAGELRQASVTDRKRDAAIRRGSLVPMYRGSYRSSGVLPTRCAELRAACVAVGPQAVASHRSALWVWQLIDDPDVLEVTVPVNHRSELTGIVLHRSTDLSETYRTIRQGVPVTTPARSLLDAGAVMSPRQLGRAVEQALIDRLITVAALRAILDDLGRRGRRGAGVLRHYLDMRALGDARAESQLEPLMARLCRDHGVGAVSFQSPLVVAGMIIRPDFQIPEARLIIEVDGLDAHGSRDAFDGDLTRQNAVIREGWLILRYTSTHLRRPAAVAREILTVARRRVSELADPTGL